MSFATKGVLKKPFSLRHIENMKIAAKGRNKGKPSPNRKPIVKLLDGVEINVYPSLKIASDILQTSRANIISSIKNGHKAKGFNWKYKDITS
jgi:hypothetical protein